MKMSRIYYLFIIIAAIILTFLSGCEEYDAGEKIYKPISFGSPPVITSIAPADSAAVGVDLITISGSNFSVSIDSNLVYFDGYRAELRSAIPTLIEAYRPNIYGDAVRITVVRPDAYSIPDTSYKMAQVTKEYGDLRQLSSQIFAIDFDSSENMYIAGINAIHKNPPGGVTVIYSTTGFQDYCDLKVGPDEFIYFLPVTPPPRDTSLIYYIDPANLNYDSLFADLPNNVNKFDFDQGHNLYACGKNGTYVVFPSGHINETPGGFSAGFVVRSIRVFSGYVYLAGIKNGSAGVWRCEITNEATGAMGTEELYFDWTLTAALTQNGLPNDITFDEDGDMYVAVEDSSVYPIIVVHHEDQSFEPLYHDSRFFEPLADQLVWGNGNFLYLNRGRTLEASETQRERVVQIRMDKSGAPYYGRN